MFTRISCLFAVLVLAPSLVNAEEIQWNTDLETAIAIASQQRKPLLLHCWFLGCGPCKQLETYVFSDQDVVRAINENVVAVKVDVRNQTAIAKRYQVNQVPHDVFISPAGYVLRSQSSPRDKAGYIKLVKEINVAYKTQETLINGSLNHPGPKEELAQFGGEIRQQSIQTSDAATSAFASRTANLVNHATGSVTNTGDMISKAAQDKYDTSSRYLPQPHNGFTPTAQNSAKENQSHQDRSTFMGKPPTNPAFLKNNTATPQQFGTVNNTFGSRDSHTPESLSSSDSSAFSNVVHNPFLDRNRSENAANSKTDSETNAVASELDDQKPVGDAPIATQVEDPSAPALDGYCSVTLQKQRKWQKGDLNWGCYHRGKLFLFAGQEQRDQFLDGPDLYSPALAGYDPVIYAEVGKLVTGKREIGVFYPARDPKIFVFASLESKQKFQSTPELFADKVRVATAECDARSNLR